jgi:MATE family multidrug resistance protein
MLSNVTVPLVGATDTIVMGHQPDAALLAGLGLGAGVFNLAFFSFNFLRMGTTGPAAQAAGAGNMAEARAILYRALGLAMLIGLALVALRPLIALGAFSISEAALDVEAAATSYLNIRLLAAPAAFAEMVLVGWLWALQDTRSAFYIQISTNLTNIVLDVLFVIGLGWGVEGAAAASAIAHGVGAVIGFVIVWRKLGPDKRVAWTQVIDWVRIRRMLVMSRDIFIRTICVVGGLLLFRYEANRFGTDAAASIEPLYQFLTITAYALDGFSHSVEPMVGDAIGKKDRRALKEAAIAALQAGGITAAIMSLFLLAFGDYVLLLFTSIPEVLAIAEQYLVYAALLPMVAVWCYLFDGMFLGAALNIAVRNAMLQAMVIYLIALFTLPRYFGMDGLWIAVMIFMGLRGVTLALRWRRLLRSAD